MVNAAHASKVFDTHFLQKLFADKLQHLDVSCRTALLTGIQQGGDPTALDRLASGRMALEAVQVIQQYLEQRQKQRNIDSNEPCRGFGVGLVNDERSHFPIQNFKGMVDTKLRRPLLQYWMQFIDVFDVVSKPPSCDADQK